MLDFLVLAGSIFVGVLADDSRAISIMGLFLMESDLQSKPLNTI